MKIIRKNYSTNQNMKNYNVLVEDPYSQKKKMDKVGTAIMFPDGNLNVFVTVTKVKLIGKVMQLKLMQHDARKTKTKK